MAITARSANASPQPALQFVQGPQLVDHVVVDRKSGRPCRMSAACSSLASWRTRRSASTSCLTWPRWRWRSNRRSAQLAIKPGWQARKKWVATDPEVGELGKFFRLPACCVESKIFGGVRPPVSAIMFAGVEMKSRLEVMGLQRGGKRFDVRRERIVPAYIQIHTQRAPHRRGRKPAGQRRINGRAVSSHRAE